jgi:hypothetical protein
MGTKFKEFEIAQENGHFIEVVGDWPICENVNGDICTGHRFKDPKGKICRSKVVVYDESRKIQFTYDGQGGTTKFDGFDPLGLSTDSQGHILIVDSYNDVVHLISQDGDFITHLLTKGDGISDPSGISVDEKDHLWLVERYSARVKVYQYLQ